MQRQPGSIRYAKTGKLRDFSGTQANGPTAYLTVRPNGADQRVTAALR